LTASIMGLVKAGDEVILIEPAYDSYRPIVETIGGIAKPIRIGPPNWSVTEDQLAAAFSAKTKAIVINSPMNPAGKVFSREELQLIASFARKFDAVVISDEVYEHLTFDGLPHVPVPSIEGMFERTVRIGSAGKMFSLTGWKVGWVEGPAALISAVSKAHQFLTFTTAPALQIAVAEGLNSHADFYLQLTRELEGNRNHLAKGLREIGFETLPAQGTYFLTTDIAKLRFNGSDVDFCKHMTEHARVAAIPLSVFYTGDAPRTLVRFAFCKRREVLDEALSRLATYFPRN
jgi:N-succinyldiaminopimelate aminotransferase